MNPYDEEQMRLRDEDNAFDGIHQNCADEIARLTAALAQAEREIEVARAEPHVVVNDNAGVVSGILRDENDAIRAQLAEAQDKLADIDHDRATHGHHSGCRINERRLRAQLEGVEGQLAGAQAEHERLRRIIHRWTWTPPAERTAGQCLDCGGRPGGCWTCAPSVDEVERLRGIEDAAKAVDSALEDDAQVPRRDEKRAATQ